MKNITLADYCLLPHRTIREAIGRLNINNTKLILVTSNKGVLLGTITDGDIRRALLKHLPENTKLDMIMNTSPKKLGVSDTEIKANKLKNIFEIPAIPQVDSQGRIIGILGLKQGTKRRDNPVFLMAGGFGKRLRPLTDHCPKPMLKVGDKPILENIIEQFIASGFHKFFISTHYLNEQIESYFGDGSQFGISIEYIREEFPLGTAGAISLLPKEVKEQHILMMNGDLLTQVKFDDFLDYHLSEAAEISMAVRDYQVQIPFGVIQHSHGKITQIKEKPIENYFINAGIYCLSPNTLKSISYNSILDMPTLIDKQISNNKHVSMFPIHEYWLDIGRLNDFEQAQVDVLKLKSIA